MDNQILLRFLSGKCSEEEEKQVVKWLNSSQANRKRLEELTLIWSASGEEIRGDKVSHWNTEQEWLRLEDRIARSEIERPERAGLSGPMRGKNPFWSSRYGQILRVAAILLVGALIGILSWSELYVSPADEPQLTFREVHMERGERSNMVLSDGSSVTVNSETHLRLPNFFHPDKREIHLISGEVYVDIVSEPDRPFLIHVDGALVEVLGTAFSVRSYPEDPDVKVVVREGTVALSDPNEPNNRVTLTSSQMGRLDRSSGQLSSVMVDDLELYHSWTDGFLKFHEAPLEVVVRQLERRFNIEILLAEESLKKLALTAELRGRTTYNVLNVISAALNIEYEQASDDRIIFSQQVLDTE